MVVSLGTVTLDGRPLGDVHVIFYPTHTEANNQKSYRYTGLTDAQGRFVMRGETDAITYVRTHYCPKAVESTAQIDFLHKHFGIKKQKGSKSSVVWTKGSYSGDYWSKGRGGYFL